MPLYKIIGEKYYNSNEVMEVNYVYYYYFVNNFFYTIGTEYSVKICCNDTSGRLHSINQRYFTIGGFSLSRMSTIKYFNGG